MPIERDEGVLKCYYAVMNDDGTYGEPILLKEIQIIEIEWKETGIPIL